MLAARQADVPAAASVSSVTNWRCCCRCKDGQPITNPLTGRKQTVQQSITMQLLLKARKGDVKAAKLIFEVLGERLLKAEETHDVTIRQTRYDNMTEEELIAENKRLDDAINNL